jgi:hypothetical protein
MTPAPIVASLAEQPAYYALYALYTDYLVNNPYHRAREYFARLKDLVRFIQPLVGRDPYFMKSWSLRLFTERAALERFSPEQAATAWWLVRQAVDAIGPPRGQPAPVHTVHSRRRPVRQAAAGPQAAPTPAPQRRTTTPVYPRSPVDYRMAV